MPKLSYIFAAPFIPYYIGICYFHSCSFVTDHFTNHRPISTQIKPMTNVCTG